MAIDLGFPLSTVVGRQVPKNSFYKHLELNTNIRRRFVDDVERITWTYKLAPSTINVADGQNVHEIVVFDVALKQKDCPDDVFKFIDKNIPRHVLFVLEYQEEYRLMLNYKELREAQKGFFSILKTFSTDWRKADGATISLQGQTMDIVYETLAGCISGYRTQNGNDTKRLVELEERIQKLNREVDALQRKIRGERQFSRQMDMNSEAREIKRQIALLQSEMDKLRK